MKEEIINICGKEIKVKNLSFLGQLRLWSNTDNKGLYAVCKECLSREDLEFLEKQDPNPDELNKLADALVKINGWDREEKKDFQQKQ